MRAGPHRPSHLHGLEIRAQVNRGERLAPEQVVGIFWAQGDGVFWTRQTRTWDLPSLTGVYAHRFTFKYIYSAWTTFPLIVKTQRRGRNAEVGSIIQMRKEAVPFLESLGIPKPRSKEEWSYIFSEVGTFLAAKNFIVNCPLLVASLKAFDSVYTKLVAGLHEQVVDGGGEGQLALQCGPQLDRRRGPCMTGWATPSTSSGSWVAQGSPRRRTQRPRSWGGQTPRSADQGTRRYPPLTAATVTAVAGRKYVNKHFPKEAKHVFWGSVECGLVLPSISA